MQTNLYHAIGSRRALAPRRLANPSRTTWLTLGVLTAVGIGATAFFFSRKAAAASAGAQAFRVTEDCGYIYIEDEAAARGAATAAAIVVHPAPSSPALGAAIAALKIVLPQCDWDTIPDSRTIVFRGAHYTWAQLRAVLEGKTVGELTSLVGTPPGGPPGGGFQAEVPAALPMFLRWMIRPQPIIYPPLPSRR